jgi:hypothetical protein
MQYRFTAPSLVLKQLLRQDWVAPREWNIFSDAHRVELSPERKPF